MSVMNASVQSVSLGIGVKRSYLPAQVSHALMEDSATMEIQRITFLVVVHQVNTILKIIFM